MYIKKSVRPIMEPSNSQALIGHSGENFHPELLKGIYFQKKKDKSRPSTQPESSSDSSLWRRPECETFLKVLHLSSAEIMKPETILETRNGARFVEMSSKPIICKFFKDFTNQ